MRTAATSAAIAAALPALIAASDNSKPYVDSESLQELVNIDDLLAGAQKLQDFADASDGNRVFGGEGHNATVDYLVEELEALDYYDVKKQPFTELFSAGTSELAVNGDEVESDILTYTPSGSYSGPVIHVDGLGCTADDYPAEAEGAVVLVVRGDCTFGEKSIGAAGAGAEAIIIYNNVPGSLAGTLGGPSDEYIPAVGLSQEAAEPIIAAFEEGNVEIELEVDATTEERITYNVIAETKEGDHDNVLVLGGHSDSVFAGPGINDDGSGIIGVLNVAKGLTKFKVNNAVRFAFWSAEEFGLLGSYYYVNSLNSSETELSKIRAYLNFDMIASPNYVYGIYDGDGSAFNLTGPPGSDVLEEDFEEFFDSKETPHVPSEFSGRSDYAAFIENGIPSGGIFTGAEVIKTEEEAELFGGEAGESYDPNYHLVGDTIDNLALDAFELNTKGIANSVAKYALSFDPLAPVDVKVRRASAERARLMKRTTVHEHHHSGSAPCGNAAKR